MKFLVGFPDPDSDEASDPWRWMLVALQMTALALVMILGIVFYYADAPQPTVQTHEQSDN